MSLLDNIDATTQLAQNNEVQLLVFKVSNDESSSYYAINVFKTREVVNAKDHFLTQIPGANPFLEGTIVLRGIQIPILDLPSWLGVNLSKEEKESSKFLICDFNGVMIGLRIVLAHRVVKKNWNELHSPDSYRTKDGGVVINDTRLEDGSLCLVLDYEKFLSEVLPQALVDIDSEVERIKTEIKIPQKLQNGTVLIAEDSLTAQNHLRAIFEKIGLKYKIFENGKELINYIESLENKDEIPAIITDIEMPEMSGFTVIKRLREDPQTNNIPVIVNSSMTGDTNKREARSLGADGFIDKTKSHNVVHLIVDAMKEKGLE